MTTSATVPPPTRRSVFPETGLAGAGAGIAAGADDGLLLFWMSWAAVLMFEGVKSPEKKFPTWSKKPGLEEELAGAGLVEAAGLEGPMSSVKLSSVYSGPSGDSPE